MRTVKGEYIVDYYDNGNILSEKFWLNGKRHREKGVAFKSWYMNGNICAEAYYINGKQLSQEEFDNRNNNCNISGKIVEINGKKYELKEV